MTDASPIDSFLIDGIFTGPIFASGRVAFQRCNFTGPVTTLDNLPRFLYCNFESEHNAIHDVCLAEGNRLAGNDQPQEYHRIARRIDFPSFSVVEGDAPSEPVKAGSFLREHVTPNLSGEQLRGIVPDEMLAIVEKARDLPPLKATIVAITEATTTVVLEDKPSE